jgi:hypothetical protein
MAPFASLRHASGKRRTRPGADSADETVPHTGFGRGVPTSNCGATSARTRHREVIAVLRIRRQTAKPPPSFCGEIFMANIYRTVQVAASRFAVQNLNDFGQWRTIGEFPTHSEAEGIKARLEAIVRKSEEAKPRKPTPASF